MIRIRRAWPIALLTVALGSACTTTDANDDESSADETANSPNELGCAADLPNETTDGSTNPLMQTWGAPCTTNQDCIDLIGDPDVICEVEAVVYELPGGYCTKPCVLPDENTQWVFDDPMCDPAGGVACLGLKGMFERCGLPCDDDQQCNRDGYTCRNFPLISMEGDPRMCLMPDCCVDSCAE